MTNDEAINQVKADAAARGATVTVETRVSVTSSGGIVRGYIVDASKSPPLTLSSVNIPTSLSDAAAAMGSVSAPPVDPPPVAFLPAAPEGLAVVPGNAQASLSWAAVVDWSPSVHSGATGYIVKRNGVTVGTPTGTSFTDTGLTNGVSVSYTVFATNSAGTSASSIAVSCTPVAPVVALPAPGSFTVTPGDSLITLSWAAVSGATGFRLKGCNQTGSTVFGSFDVAANHTSDHFDAVNGVLSYFMMCALSGTAPNQVEGPNTAILSATAVAVVVPPVTPTAPTGLTATAGDARVTLGWTAPSGATSYNVKRKTTGAFTTIATPASNSYVDTTAVNGTAYTYAVSAVNSAGTSADSSTASATPVAGTPTVAKMPIGTQPWHGGWMDPSFTFKANPVFDGVSNPFNPLLIADLARYSGPYRGMDFMATVQSTLASWGARTKLTDPLSVQLDDNGICPELLITLCEAAGRDIWVCIPTRTAVGRNANDYALQYATYILAHTSPNRKVYVEFSNETWNGGPNGGPGSNSAGYCITQGKALGLPGSAGDGYEGGFRYHAIAALKCHQAFESVFGVNSPRLVKVLAGQRGNPGLVDIHAQQYVSEGGTISASNTAYAIAPYFGSDSTTIAQMSNDLDSMIANDMNPVVSRAITKGFMPVCYEGGAERFNTGAPALSADPAMTGLYTRLYDAAAAAGIKVFVNYLHISPNQGNEAWGALKQHGDWTTPKGVAILAAIAKYK